MRGAFQVRGRVNRRLEVANSLLLSFTLQVELLDDGEVLDAEEFFGVKPDALDVEASTGG
ncbi:hypothetical protein KDK_02920 [Dictyobacter kobayashii]|uniref:Uncharacterized protein n=1 Tax=Dictyobacter kobayashii TaxID=2014872 RepID=A0A402ABM5_9CHLR|nr:hypothetical protein KDK_02920 [Dictyobacter kobayashii]